MLPDKPQASFGAFRPARPTAGETAVRKRSPGTPFSSCVLAARFGVLCSRRFHGFGQTLLAQPDNLRHCICVHPLLLGEELVVLALGGGLPRDPPLLDCLVVAVRHGFRPSTAFVIEKDSAPDAGDFDVATDHCGGIAGRRREPVPKRLKIAMMGIAQRHDHRPQLELGDRGVQLGIAGGIGDVDAIIGRAGREQMLQHRRLALGAARQVGDAVEDVAGKPPWQVAVEARPPSGTAADALRRSGSESPES
jgi:hypothetical protein